MVPENSNGRKDNATPHRRVSALGPTGVRLGGPHLCTLRFFPRRGGWPGTMQYVLSKSIPNSIPLPICMIMRTALSTDAYVTEDRSGEIPLFTLDTSGKDKFLWTAWLMRLQANPKIGDMSIYQGSNRCNLLQAWYLNWLWQYHVLRIAPTPMAGVIYPIWKSSQRPLTTNCPVWVILQLVCP